MMSTRLTTKHISREDIVVELTGTLTQIKTNYGMVRRTIPVTDERESE